MNKYRVCANKGCRRKAIDATNPSPYEYIDGKHITIFGWTLLLYKETTVYAVDICNDCLADQTQESQRQAYYSGVDYGYEKGLHDQ